ncbi:unnamed protein product [Rotaria magnacalcarata]|uniref:Dynamin N-terminal domain-containing protein n=2 Tax=Rotaria magnacalcarata TaxID=392030 RepID=A0A815Z5B0_9BILA|nr:unnamed protein product [Rotaria magnacalcarata]CAF3943829.1 unnamed protein product [Rotaria magnacalcarata]
MSIKTPFRKSDDPPDLPRKENSVPFSTERYKAPLPTPPNRNVNDDLSNASQRSVRNMMVPEPPSQSEHSSTLSATDDPRRDSFVANWQSSTFSLLKRNLKTNIGQPMAHSSVAQASYERGAQASVISVNQIEADKIETRNIIANYGVEPFEMLHLVDIWLQQLLDEFCEQRDHFKHKLKEKWLNQELTQLKYDNNDRVRKIHAAYVELEKARDEVFSRESFNELHSYLRNADENATDEMKEKFNSLVENYFKTLQHLQFIDKETKATSNDYYIGDLKKYLSKLKELNDKESHTICIVGLEKAGKSTFINALLGFELLPTASERCTQLRTVLKPPIEDDDQRLFATVKFYDDQEFRMFFDKMTKKTDESQEQLEQRKKEVSQEREMLKAKFPEECFYLGGSSDVQRERAVIIRKLHEYITGELYVNIIKEIAIYTDKLPGKNYELLDVPGFDSPIKEHREAGLKAVKTADAFLFLTNGQQPSLTEPQICLLREIQENQYEAMERAFGIITKLDLCQTAEKYQEHYAKAANELFSKDFKQEHIYVACPRIQILDPNCEEFRVIEHKLRNFGEELEHGFEQSKRGLKHFIECELPKTHLKQLVDLGRMRLARSVLDRLEQIKEKQLLPENLTKMSIDEYIKEYNIEKWDHIYNKDIFVPAFTKVNVWHTTIITKQRSQFIDGVKQKFFSSFMDHTKELIERKHPIEQLIYETRGYSKVQLNTHPIDNAERESLSVELEKIVDKTSDILAEYFFHEYICEFENILNEVCPQLRDLYRAKLTMEKCKNETHALILRVCRPIIMASLRYSHSDLEPKRDAISYLISIAPIVAFNIANSLDRDGTSGALGKEIYEAAESLAAKNTPSAAIIKALFKK